MLQSLLNSKQFPAIGLRPLLHYTPKSNPVPQPEKHFQEYIIIHKPQPSFSALPSPLSALQPLFWEHEGHRAIRSGDWKLVSKHPGPWALYDMTTDRTEMSNLAAQQPDRVREMAAQWDTWAKRVGVLPWPLDGGEGKKGTGKTK
jgi:arylsulfatase A-like enzyme